jgi:hypothetical protein
VEFGLKLTYMETRFLVDDLKVMPKDPEPPKAPAPAPAANSTPAAPAPANESAPEEFTEEELPPPGAPSLTLTVDQITKPGALVSGQVTFSDGQNAAWYLDQMGRLGVVPKQQGYKPSAADVQQFQLTLQRELQKLGY